MKYKDRKEKKRSICNTVSQDFMLQYFFYTSYFWTICNEMFTQQKGIKRYMSK